MKKIDKSWGGSWTEQKLQAFEKYVNAYLTIMLNQRRKFNGWPQTIIYIDGFAGCGDRFFTKDQDTLSFSELNIDESEIKVYKGSAERVVKLDKKFDEYYFIDTDENALNKLKTKIEPHFDEKSKYVFWQKDINAALIEFSNYLDNSKVALILLDPFGMQLNWESIEKFKNKRVDVWILLPSGVIINRLLDRQGNLKNINKLESFFGITRDEIQKEFYESKKENTLFGEIEINHKVHNAIEKIAELYIKRLKTIWDYVTEKPLVLYNNRNVPIYHFVFASNNKTAKNIASQIIIKK
ncbi:MAG TPA: three-Cys-motif partner protein TcmP [Bacteroidales bacterium]|jgi:three-Cys-motif partner protein|nr:three-Cys-motif partner protein TcmP [Bacteroidales bacterium]HOF07528.1 three-Cys-motif partner protein TcmP [Bacteroidales bacterium]HON97835.1 three-Cys-motif partner protein TcmP [Bacteroidales bacterium]HPX46063.1 three-Cys-motif partner protein TcmP [Bacteroidales bacterium]HQE78493.1 three-Cys-motif partner protein TcmP [Bacteroidales bacterium]